GPMPCGDTGVLLAETNITWKDLAWIRDAWRGPIVIKGVHTGDVARQAVDAGADAVIGSNPGGRQLDGVAASIRVLPEVVAAVGDRVEVLMDGGIARGAHIAKGPCPGARGRLRRGCPGRGGAEAPPPPPPGGPPLPGAPPGGSRWCF